MAEYDDGAYYEVQLNNKQLVFFFMAALSIAVVVFLCGVMVGRGVHDATLLASQNDITSGTLRGDGLGSSASLSSGAESAAAMLDYTNRLERDTNDESLKGAESSDATETEGITSDSPESTVAGAVRPAEPKRDIAGGSQAAAPQPRPQTQNQAPTRTSAKAEAAAGGEPKATMSVFGRPSGAFTIQVVALKTADAARSLMGRLQSKNYRAYLEDGGEAGLHRVRVGRFATRTEAERVARKLQDEWKFRPYITQ